MSYDLGELTARVARREAADEIRQLAARYAVALDERDLTAFVGLFTVDGVLAGSRIEARGHEQIRAGILAIVTRWTGPTVHFVGNHAFTLDDDAHAHGVVYCRAEHEFGDRWVIQMLRYDDRYVRAHDGWLFARRDARSWYATDLLERPNGARKMRWGDGPPREAELPEAWPTYRAFVAARNRPVQTA